jgi:hypothetical protein
VSTLEESFAMILGRQPSDAERQLFLRERDALHLKDNDALWRLLMVLGHFETLYGQIPARIAKVAATVTENTKTAAEAELKAASARTRAELAKSVAQTAHDIAGSVASAQRSRWFLIGALVATAVFVGAGASMFRIGVKAGQHSGELDGYSKARDEKAATAWANTPEGQLGYKLAKAGALREMATCTGKNLVRRGDLCLVRGCRESVLGWKINVE